MTTEKIDQKVIDHYAESNKSWNSLQAVATEYYQNRSPENRAELMARLIPLLESTVKAEVNRATWGSTYGFSSTTVLVEKTFELALTTPTKLIGSSKAQYNPELGEKEDGALIRSYMIQKVQWKLNDVLRKICGRSNDPEKQALKFKNGLQQRESFDQEIEQQAAGMLDFYQSSDFVAQLVYEDFFAKFPKAWAELTVEDRILLTRYYRAEDTQEELAADYAVSVKKLKQRVEKLEGILRRKL